MYPTCTLHVHAQYCTVHTTAPGTWEVLDATVIRTYFMYISSLLDLPGPNVFAH